MRDTALEAIALELSDEIGLTPEQTEKVLFFAASAVDATAAFEREACAKVADDYATANAPYLVSRSVASAIASAIRARG